MKSILPAEKPSHPSRAMQKALGGFEAPKWSLRVSLANLPEEAYAKIGEHLRRAVRGYVEEWKRSRKEN